MKQYTTVALAAMLSSPSVALCAAEPPAAVRPNILYLLADDWAWPHASCLGAPGIKTPVFDRLVREGVMFRNAQYIRKDPFELHNLAGDPALAETVALLDTRLMAELKATADPRLSGVELDQRRN